ncbi:hypothetical protein L7F22_007851 [Adiantum nelumboides]|nr:hypothetical protein [Adiantum nelumboides]
MAAVLSSLGARTNRLGAAASSPGPAGTPASPTAAHSSSAKSGAGSAATAAAAVATSPLGGTKLAYQSLRQSAGMLSYINENFLHAPSTDLSKDVVKWLVDVELAQATEVFWEKTLEEKKGGSLVARLACQASILYGNLAEEAKEWITKAVFERSWGLLVQYHRATVDSGASAHGVALVRLTLSESLAKEAQKLCSSFSVSITGSHSTLPADAGTSLKSLIDAHLAQATAKKQTAIKDNDLIYHDILPTESTLAPIEPLPAATPISIQEVYSSADIQKLIGATTGAAPANDLFSNLVPLGVHEAASMYSEEKAKLVRSESEKATLADGQLTAALEYMGLPQSLNKFRQQDGAGDSGFDDLIDPGKEVREWSEEEIAGGGSLGMDGLGSGSSAVDDALQSLSVRREKARADMQEASRLLDDEAAQCEKLRVRFGDKWTQAPSGSATRALRSDIKSNREALDQAVGNDEAIARLWKEEGAMIRVLLSGNEGLEAAFIEAVSGSGNSGARNGSQPQLLDLTESEETADEEEKRRVESLVSSIESHLSALHRVKRERSESLSELRNRIQSDDISHLLILNRRSPPEAQTQLFQQELDKFRTLTQRSARSVTEQERLVGEVTKAWKKLTSTNLGKTLSTQYEAKRSARQSLIARLRRAKDAHAQVRAGLGKALAFYGQLEEIGTELKRNAKSFSEERRAERERLRQEVEWEERGTDGSSSLESSLGGLNLGRDTSQSWRSAGPPQVPPPQQQQQQAYQQRYAPPPPPTLPQQQPHYQQTSQYQSPVTPTSPYDNLDFAFGGGSGASAAAPAPPPPSSRQASYASPPPPSHPSYTSPPPPPQRSAYASPPPPRPTPCMALRLRHPPPHMAPRHHLRIRSTVHRRRQRSLLPLLTCRRRRHRRNSSRPLAYLHRLRNGAARSPTERRHHRNLPNSSSSTLGKCPQDLRRRLCLDNRPILNTDHNRRPSPIQPIPDIPPASIAVTLRGLSQQQQQQQQQPQQGWPQQQQHPPYR